METLLIVLLVVLVAGFAGLFFLLLKRQTSGRDQSLVLLQNQIQEITRTLDAKLSESTKTIQRVSERLIKLDETNKQVINFADQLQNLQDILKNPKQRGVIGEYFLEAVLKNVLPPGSYEMQYTFKDGTVVDAVVKVKDKIIPIDSKFSLENYNRLIDIKEGEERKKLEQTLRQDLKNRIDETAKYIKPNEGTMDFAFMFIPSEALFYDLLINKVGSVTTRDLIEYATGEKKVIIVSPTSFLAFLQTVLQGLRALQIEESAKEIRKWVVNLKRHLEVYSEYMKKLRTHLETVVNTFNTAYKEFRKIDKDIYKITGESTGVEPLELEKPNNDEE